MLTKPGPVVPAQRGSSTGIPEPPGQLARAGRGVRFGDRRHDAGLPVVLLRVASSCHDAALGVRLLTVSLGVRAWDTVRGPRIAATAAMMQGIV
jgi:hypothetical protein